MQIQGAFVLLALEGSTQYLRVTGELTVEVLLTYFG